MSKKASQEQGTGEEQSTPKTTIPTSTVKATIGRVVLVFAAGEAIRWDGAQPADVVGGPFFDGDKQLVNVNVKVDAANNPAVLEAFRERRDGNTLSSVPLYDPLTDEQRSALLAAGVSGWAEWMPFQAGQAKQSQDLAGAVRTDLEALTGRVAMLERDLARARGAVSELMAFAVSEPKGAAHAEIAQAYLRGALDDRLAV